MPVTPEADDRYVTHREAAEIIEADRTRYLSRVEAEQRFSAIEDQIELLRTAHTQQHDQEAIAVKLELRHQEQTRDEHEQAHFRDHLAHEKIHSQENDSISKALSATQTLAASHDKAHEREHEAHTREHALDKLAIDKAEKATDQRFVSEGSALDTLRKEMDRRLVEAVLGTETRYEENRKRIEALEKGDVKGEGKVLGMSNVAAMIVGGAGLIATVLGIVIVIANFLTRTPAS